MLLRLFRRPEPVSLAPAPVPESYESRLHRLEIANRDLLARLAAVEQELAFLVNNNPQESHE